jgi:hypothetical protein
MMSQIKGITTSRTSWCDCAGPWATAWPLSADYYLCSYNGDIVFINSTAARLMVCPLSATPAATLPGFKLLDPIPVKPRTPPPNIAVQTYEGERAEIKHQPARLSVLNVYESDQTWPAGMKAKWLRVVQIIPKNTINISEPRVGYAAEALVRVPLGIVPVEPDGSANFEAPVDRCLLFQVLDSNRMVIQSMRSVTYVHKGEHLSCVGCHEDKWKAVPPLNPIALNRPPSRLEPEIKAAIPMNFHRYVKPVFEARCAPCHIQQGKGPDMSYASLKSYAFYFCGDGTPYLNGDILTPLHGGSRTIPGKCGARMAALMNYCRPAHYNVSLTADELHRITLWLDCNSNELGSDQNPDAQRRGELVWPDIDFNPQNPLGVEEPTSADAAATVNVTPGSAVVKPAGSVQFTATAVDSLNRTVLTQPVFSWSVSGGGSMIQASGLFTAGTAEGGPFTVTATALLNGSVQSFRSSVTVTSLTGLPLVGGSIRQLLCLTNASSTTCAPAADTAAITGRYAAARTAPLPGTQALINGSTYEWRSTANGGGVWFTGCGDNLTSYAAITIVNNRARTCRFGYIQDDEVTVWMNGARLFTDRTWTSSERLSPAFSLPRGNVFIFIKQTNTGGPGNLALRIADSLGNGVPDLLYYLDPAQTGALRVPAAAKAAAASFSIRAVRGQLKISGRCVGAHRVEVFNAQGQRLALFSGTGDVHYSLAAEPLPAGLLLVRMTIGGRTVVQPVPIAGK